MTDHPDSQRFIVFILSQGFLGETPIGFEGIHQIRYRFPISHTPFKLIMLLFGLSIGPSDPREILP